MFNTKLLKIDVITDNQDPIIPGESRELKVIITNGSDDNIRSIKVYFDDLPESIRQWYQVIYYQFNYSTIKRTYEQFNLASRQTHEVVFRWQIPINAFRSNYYYNLVIDSEEFVNPIIRKQQLNISQKKSEKLTAEPTFYLELINQSSNNGKRAISSSVEPLELDLQSFSQTIKVIVDNRTDRLDNFRLQCNDLSKQWFTVQYPQGDDRLYLNPSKTGEITFFLRPPLDAPEGIYSPTIQLKSANNPNLFIGDILYFKIPNIDKFEAIITPSMHIVKNEPVTYNLSLTNEGNTTRHINLELDQETKNKCFEYSLSSSQVELEQDQKKKLNCK